MTTSIASTQSSTASQPDMLGSAPSLHFDDFCAKVAERAMLKGTTLDTWGLLSQVLPADKFLALPRAQPADHPILDCPYPGLLDPTASRAVQEAHATALKRHRAFNEALAELRGEILDLAGPWVVQTYLIDRTTRLLLDTVPNIMARLRLAFSIKTPGQLKALKKALTMPLVAADSATVATFFSDRDKTLTSLTAAGQPVTPLDQIEQIIAACGGRGFAYIDEMITCFHTTYLTPEQQTPAVLTQLIIDRSNNEAPTSTVIAAVRAVNSDSKHTKLGKLYCYHHGFCGHKGADCTYMLRNHSFTAEQRAATSPASVPGGFTGRRLFKPAGP